jgi:hypothetical protein
VVDEQTIVVGCGGCGRRVRVALKTLLGLRTFNCSRCRSRLETTKRSPKLGDAEQTDVGLAQILDTLTDRELAMLVRKAAGFSDCELIEMYGTSAAELERLVKRLADRIRLLYSGAQDEQ